MAVVCFRPRLQPAVLTCSHLLVLTPTSFLPLHFPVHSFGVVLLELLTGQTVDGLLSIACIFASDASTSPPAANGESQAACGVPPLSLTARGGAAHAAAALRSAVPKVLQVPHTCDKEKLVS